MAISFFLDQELAWLYLHEFVPSEPIFPISLRVRDHRGPSGLIAQRCITLCRSHQAFPGAKTDSCIEQTPLIIIILNTRGPIPQRLFSREPAAFGTHGAGG